jgi:hypothetical protein
MIIYFNVVLNLLYQLNLILRFWLDSPSLLDLKGVLELTIKKKKKKKREKMIAIFWVTMLNIKLRYIESFFMHSDYTWRNNFVGWIEETLKKAHESLMGFKLPTINYVGNYIVCS